MGAREGIGDCYIVVGGHHVLGLYVEIREGVVQVPEELLKALQAGPWKGAGS